MLTKQMHCSNFISLNKISLVLDFFPSVYPVILSISLMVNVQKLRNTFLCIPCLLLCFICKPFSIQIHSFVLFLRSQYIFKQMCFLQLVVYGNKYVHVMFKHINVLNIQQSWDGFCRKLLYTSTIRKSIIKDKLTIGKMYFVLHFCLEISSSKP